MTAITRDTLDPAPWLPWDAAEFWTVYCDARRDELRRIISALPVGPRSRVLDVVCGDGAASLLLRECAARVIGVDASPAMLEVARARAARARMDILFLHGHAGRLPFADAQFDLTFCVRDLADTEDPQRVAREMLRVTCPGGFVAVLESDFIGQLNVSWPATLDLALRQAVLRAYVARAGTSSPRVEGHRARRWLGQVGATLSPPRPYVIERHRPLPPAELRFLRYYFTRLLETTSPFLDEAMRARAAALLRPGSEDELLLRPDFHLIQLVSMILAERPSALRPAF